MPKKLTKDEFAAKLSTIHPNLELISEYDGNRKKVDVICRIHNYIYSASPKSLMSGCGCQKCYNDRRGESTRKTIEQFINESKLVHGDKYDYSKVQYVNSSTKVCIICPVHGEFWQTPDKHILRRHGCPKCAGRNKTTESVIDEFREVHGDKYDYSKVDYVNNSTKVVIICKKHGIFLQTPDSHLQGSGCPVCNESKLESLVRNFLLKNNIEFELQKHFKWLGRQSVDFYLPKQNIAIECQGEQHFSKSYGIYLKKSSLSERIERDVTKNTLCKKNNVKLLYIMDKKWLTKCMSEEFCCIYSVLNTIPSDNLSMIINESLQLS